MFLTDFEKKSQEHHFEHIFEVSRSPLKIFDISAKGACYYQGRPFAYSTKGNIVGGEGTEFVCG